MTNQRRDSHLGKAEIVGDAREAMAQDVRCHIGQWRVLEDVLPMVREATERIVLSLPGKTYVPTSSVRRRSRYSTTGKPIGRMDSPSLQISNRKQLASVSASVHFKPIISLRRQSVSAIWRMMFHDRGVFLLLGGVAEHPTQYSILRLREPTLPHVVLWLAESRVALDNPCFDGVGKDAAEKTDGTRGRSSTASDDGLSAQLLGLDRNPRFSGHNVLENLVDVGLSEILNPPGTYEWNNVTLEAAGVGDNR
jgi:hypothetical protein